MNSNITAPVDLIVLSMRDEIGIGWLVAHAKSDAAAAALPALIETVPGAFAYGPVEGSSGCPELGRTKGGFCFQAEAWQNVFLACDEHGLRLQAQTVQRGKELVAA